MNSTQGLFGGMRFKDHPSYKEFDYKGVKVCEVVADWTTEEEKLRGIQRMKLIWVRDSFETLEIDGKRNALVHKDFSDLRTATYWGTYEELVRTQVAQKFDEYWGLRNGSEGVETEDRPLAN